MRIFGVFLAVCSAGAIARAEPAADLIVVWAPGARTAPIEAVAHRHGAAVIDKSPTPAEAAKTSTIVQDGIAKFEALQFDDAWTQLKVAASEVDRTGAAGLTRAQLSDLFLYRALVLTQQGDATTAWEELVKANVIDPTRVLDPARVEPRVRQQFDRARDTVTKRDRATLTVSAPAGCAVAVDGEAITGAIDKPVGPHWLNVTCPDRTPYGVRIELTGPVTYPVTPPPYSPPSDTELLVQARAAGARAMIVAEVHGAVASARLVGADGRDRDRRTVTITGDLSPLADAISDMLAPPPVHHWYQSKWAYAGGAAALAAIILVPVTAIIASGSGPTTWGARPKGLPPL